MNSKREFGIDLLRIVSMLMIVVLHLIGEGGVLKSVSFSSSNYSLVWFIKIISYCAVDCYAMISGYVMYNRKFKLHKILSLWFQILFYSIGIFAFLYICDYTNDSLFYYFFPISKKMYWYLTAYIGVLIVAPFLNFIINKLEKKSLIITLFNIIFFFSINPLMLSFDSFGLNDGYSFVWLSLLYIIGGVIAKFSIFKKVSYYNCMYLYLGSVFFVWLFKIGIEYIHNSLNIVSINSNLFIKYNSVFILFSSIGLLLFFAKLKTTNKYISKVVSTISPLTLGVYLIHSHPIVYNKILHNFFADLSSLPPFIMISLIILNSLFIFFICIIIEKIRMYIFKFIHLDYFCQTVVTRFKSIEEYIYEKIAVLFM